MNIHDDIAVVVGIITILSAIHKFVFEPNINAKITDLKDKLNERIIATENKVNIHLQDYINYKEANLLQANGLNEKINHTWSKTKELFNEEKVERKEIQAFIQKQHELKNRD
ncbi:hypothetical protein PQG02_06970 [Nostoc sp. UHCC 0926]|uniref:hypothetical protein n=1 Tax=unclassified Nostoc TaxID=2593658 RepID=UPI00235EA79A|nr:hypothetical protein [Nostoc sp. UHCC 0926]WDD34083.1 hypothetical protein PQG02_06970 [Nostoc sp. UHCC 0926]